MAWVFSSVGIMGRSGFGLLFSLLFLGLAKSQGINDDDKARHLVLKHLVHIIENPEQMDIDQFEELVQQLASQQLHVISKENMIKYYNSFSKAFDILREKMKALELDLDSNRFETLDENVLKKLFQGQAEMYLFRHKYNSRYIGYFENVTYLEDRKKVDEIVHSFKAIFEVYITSRWTLNCLNGEPQVTHCELMKKAANFLNFDYDEVMDIHFPKARNLDSEEDFEPLNIFLIISIVLVSLALLMTCFCLTGRKIQFPTNYFRMRSKRPFKARPAFRKMDNEAETEVADLNLDAVQMQAHFFNATTPARVVLDPSSNEVKVTV